MQYLLRTLYQQKAREDRNQSVVTAREALEPIEPQEEGYRVTGRIMCSRTQRTKRIHVLRTDVLNVPTYSVYFLGVQVVYLKDYSPYLKQFSPCSKSQNITRVNLLGTYSIIKLIYNCYLYTQPINKSTVVFLIRLRYSIRLIN